MQSASRDFALLCAFKHDPKSAETLVNGLISICDYATSLPSERISYIRSGFWESLSTVPLHLDAMDVKGFSDDSIFSGALRSLADMGPLWFQEKGRAVTVVRHIMHRYDKLNQRMYYFKNMPSWSNEDEIQILRNFSTQLVKTFGVTMQLQDFLMVLHTALEITNWQPLRDLSMNLSVEFAAAVREDAENRRSEQARLKALESNLSDSDDSQAENDDSELSLELMKGLNLI